MSDQMCHDQLSFSFWLCVAYRLLPVLSGDPSHSQGGEAEPGPFTQVTSKVTIYRVSTPF